MGTLLRILSPLAGLVIGASVDDDHNNVNCMTIYRDIHIYDDRVGITQGYLLYYT